VPEERRPRAVRLRWGAPAGPVACASLRRASVRSGSSRVASSAGSVAASTSSPVSARRGSEARKSPRRATDLGLRRDRTRHRALDASLGGMLRRWGESMAEQKHAAARLNPALLQLDQAWASVASIRAPPAEITLRRPCLSSGREFSIPEPCTDVDSPQWRSSSPTAPSGPKASPTRR
jgi:hypothetical protein